MTLEERVAAIERTLAHQQEMGKLRQIAEDLKSSRAEHVEEQLDATKKVLPKLQAAMKELEEASAVTGHLQARQALLLKGHAEWLHSHDRAMKEIRENGRKIDERIENLVSAIGELIPGRNGKQAEKD